MGSEAVDDYRQSLSDLTFNSKPQISMLTMLADENQAQAQQIVHVIETHIQKSKPTLKLPALYLLDSIIKNVHKGPYVQNFSQNIVFTFCHVFEKGDEKTRVALFKLRQTWNDIFPQKKLYAIDIRVRAIDPAWPVMAKPPDPSSKQSIHVNPKFIKKADPRLKQQEKTREASPPVISPELQLQEKGVDEEAAMRKQLLAKQQELLKLQQQQLELELQQTKARIEQQQQQLKHKEKIKAVYSSANLPLPDIDPQLDMLPPSPEIPSEAVEMIPTVVEPAKPSVAPPRRRDPRLAKRDPRLEAKSNAPATSAVTTETTSPSPATQGLLNPEAAQMLAHQLSQIAHTGVNKNTLDLLGQLQVALAAAPQGANKSADEKIEPQQPTTAVPAQTQQPVDPRMSQSDQNYSNLIPNTNQIQQQLPDDAQTAPNFDLQYQMNNAMPMMPMQMPMGFPGQFPGMQFPVPGMMPFPQPVDVPPPPIIPVESIPIPPTEPKNSVPITNNNNKIGNKKEKADKKKELEAWKEKKRLEEKERLRKERERMEFKERERERERMRRHASHSRRSPGSHRRNEDVDEFGRIRKPRSKSKSRSRSRSLSRERDPSSRRSSPRSSSSSSSKEKVSSRRNSKDSTSKGSKREEDKSKKSTSSSDLNKPEIRKKPFKLGEKEMDKTMSSDSDAEKLKIDVTPTRAFKDIIGKIVKDSVERMQGQPIDEFSEDVDMRKKSEQTADVDYRIPQSAASSDPVELTVKDGDLPKDVDLRKKPASRFEPVEEQDNDESVPMDISDSDQESVSLIEPQDIDYRPRRRSVPQVPSEQDMHFMSNDVQKTSEVDVDMRKTPATTQFTDEPVAASVDKENVDVMIPSEDNQDVNADVSVGGDVDMRFQPVIVKNFENIDDGAFNDKMQLEVPKTDEREMSDAAYVEPVKDIDFRKRPVVNHPIEDTITKTVKDVDLRSRTAPVFSSDVHIKKTEDNWSRDLDMRPRVNKDTDMRIPHEEFRAKRVESLRLGNRDDDIRARLSQWAQRNDTDDRKRTKRDGDSDSRHDRDMRSKRDRDIDLRNSKSSDESSTTDVDLRQGKPGSDTEPPVKKPRSDTDEKENISDDSSSEKGKDQDFRQSGKITNTGWAKFKASHPDEFPFQQPQEMELLKSPATPGELDMRMAPPLMPLSDVPNEDVVPTGEFSPEPPEERRSFRRRREFSPERRRMRDGGRGGGGGRFNRRQTDFPPSVPPPMPPPGAPIEALIEHQEAMLRHLDIELKTKNLHPHKMREIRAQMVSLRQMRDMLRQSANEAETGDKSEEDHNMMPPPAPPAGLIGKDSPKLPSRRHERDERANNSGDNVELVVPGKPILHTFTHLPPHIDPAQLPFDDENNLEDREEVVIDRRTFEIRMGQKPRRIELGDEPYWFRVDPVKRQVLMNDRAVYKIGSPMKEVKVGLRKFMICYRGPVKKIWIDGMQFDIRLNGPPQKIFIDNTQHDIRIDGFQRNEVLIDGIGQGPFGGQPRVIMIAFTKHEIRFDQPRREILIDGKICQLHLTYPVPVIFMGDKPHGICFDGPPRDLFIDSKAYRLPMDNTAIIRIGPRPHRVAFLGPGHEVMIDGRTYEVFFDAPPREINISGRLHNLSLKGPPPEVKILDEIPVDPATGELLFVPKSFKEANKKDKYGRLDKNSKSFREYSKKSDSFDSNGQTRMQQMNAMGANMMGMGGMMNPMGMMMGGMMNPMGMMMTPDIRMQMMQGMANPMMGINPMMNPMMQQQMMLQAQQSMQGQMMPNVMNAVNSQQNMLPAAPQQPSAVPSQTPEQQTSAASEQKTDSSSVNVMDLLNKLKMFGMLNEQKKKQEEKDAAEAAAELNTTENVIAESESLNCVAPIADLTSLDITLLRKHHPGVIQRLYLGIQCSSCGVRFVHEDCDRYRLHLDWHFRLNKRGKDDMKIAHFRKWFYDAADWVDFVEIQDEEEKARKNFFARSMQAQQEMGIHPGGMEDEQISCPAATGREIDDVCEICRDPFEQFWDEEAEEWHLKDAIRVDHKTYHPVCYEDANVTLLLDTPTPTPEVTSRQPFFPQSNLVPTNLFAAEKSEETEIETKTEDPDPAPEATPIPPTDNGNVESTPQNVDNSVPPSLVLKIEPKDIKTENPEEPQPSAIPAELLPPTPPLKMDSSELPLIVGQVKTERDTPTPPGSPVEETSSVLLPGTRIPFPFPSQSSMQTSSGEGEQPPVVVVMKPEESASQINVISSRLPKFFPN